VCLKAPAHQTANTIYQIKRSLISEYMIQRNYSGTPILEYNTDFIGLILKTKKFEYLILKFYKPMISMDYVYKNSGIIKS